MSSRSSSETNVESSKDLKAEAARLGFFACGIARARPVDEKTAAHYRQWIADGRQADMHYLENNIDKRLDPTLLLDGARSIVVVAMNYTPARTLPDSEYQIAAYALGRDYHDVLRDRLRQLLTHHEAKVCVDTVPILERYWAQQAGLGSTGRNHQLIIPRAGSMFFLGEIVTTAEFDHYDPPFTKNLCGTCHRCIDACPTQALTGRFDARRCLSFQTIENRGEIDDGMSGKMGNCIYGCDRCQQACPWNHTARPTDIAEMHPSQQLMEMRRDDWHQLTPDDFRRLFRGSSVKRAKYEGLMRNIRAVEASSNTHDATDGCAPA